MVEHLIPQEAFLDVSEEGALGYVATDAEFVLTESLAAVRV